MLEIPNFIGQAGRPSPSKSFDVNQSEEKTGKKDTFANRMESLRQQEPKVCEGKDRVPPDGQSTSTQGERTRSNSQENCQQAGQAESESDTAARSQEVATAILNFPGSDWRALDWGPEASFSEEPGSLAPVLPSLPSITDRSGGPSIETTANALAAKAEKVERAMISLFAAETEPGMEAARNISQEKVRICQLEPTLTMVDSEAGDSVEQDRSANIGVKRIIELESCRSAGRKPLPPLAERETLPKGAHLLGNSKGNGEGEPSWIEWGRLGPNFASTGKNSINPRSIMQQIVQKIEFINTKPGSQMEIHLKPEFLGKMTIKLTFEEGMLTARFFTESPQVKQILEFNLNSLKQTLESNGLKVERAEVNLQLDSGADYQNANAGRQQTGQEQNHSPGRYRYSHAEESDIPPGLEPLSRIAWEATNLDGYQGGELSLFI